MVDLEGKRPKENIIEQQDKSMNKDDGSNKEKETKNNTETEKEDCAVISIKCSQCRFVANSNLELKGHAKFVHLTCRFCNKFCKNLILMDKHMKEDHPRDHTLCAIPARCYLLAETHWMSTLKGNMQRLMFVKCVIKSLNIGWIL